MLPFAESHSSLWKYFFLVRIHCRVYIINSLLAAICLCRRLSYLLDCKPRLIKLFSSFHAAYNQERITFLFFYFIERHRWRCLSLATFCRRYSFAFYFLQHHVHIRHRRDYDNRRQLWWCKHHWYGKRTSMRTSRMYLRGLDTGPSPKCLSRRGQNEQRGTFLNTILQ